MKIVFSRFQKYQERINDIAILIKRANPQVELKNELTDAQ